MKLLKSMRIISLSIAIILAIAFVSSCDKKEDITDENTSVDAVVQDNTEDSDTSKSDETSSKDSILTAPPVIEVIQNETSEDTEEETIDYVDGNYNLLTGEECDLELSKQRPVGIMVNNLKASLPQLGVSEADIMYEVRAEGGITRYLALFLDYKNLPETGSVRSSRDYYIDLVQAHDAIYAHCGGSVFAYNTIAERGIDNLDGTNDRTLPNNTYFRNYTRLQTMASEHTMMTNGAGLTKAIESKGYRTSITDGFTGPFKFSKNKLDLSEGLECGYIHIPFSNYVSAYFDYDKNSGEYKKGQYFNDRNSLDKHNSPQIDGTTKEQLSFTNVFVFSAKHSEISGDSKGRISVDFVGEGKGYYATSGKCIDVIWKKADRESPYKVYLADGETELLVNVGKSYIAIVPDDIIVTLKDS